MAQPMLALPRSWSNANRDEKLRADARDSFSRMIARAVAETGVNFQLYDALRTRAEQIALFKKHYYYTGRRYKKYTTDRWYNGSVWGWRGFVRVASPDVGSNHETGVAVDLHPGAIQDWVKVNGRRFGWDWAEGKRNKEDWHFRYFPHLDQYTREGYLDHAAVQKIVGASVDGKIGTGTVEKIKEWQKANELKPDGKVGLDTKRAMGLMGGSTTTIPEKPKPAPKPVEVPPETKTDGGFTYTYLREDWDDRGVGEKVHPFTTVVKGAYIHHPAAGNVILANESVEQTMARLRSYRRQHTEDQGWHDIGYQVAFDQRGFSYQLRGADMESGANGGAESNDEATSFLLLLGEGEKPSPEMIKAVNGFLAQQKDVFPESKFIRGHRESPDAKTSCPGPIVMAEIQNGTFSFKGVPYVSSGEKVTRPTSKVPTGKALLMALIAAPDFPLLRTEKHKCYYGPASGPIESVSGKNENSLNPGDIVNDCSQGLKDFQQQLRKRGYNIKADGKFGDETEKATKNLQRLAGLTQDGKIGPDTWYAAYIFPVQ